MPMGSTPTLDTTSPFGPFRIGDTVKHRPSGETWLVAAVDGDSLYPAGWPESCARTADCELVEAASDEDHVRAVLLVRGSTGRRAALAEAHGCSVCTRALTAYRNPDDSGNRLRPEARCIGCGAMGCTTAWGDWCFRCNVERMDRISGQLEAVAANLKARSTS